MRCTVANPTPVPGKLTHIVKTLEGTEKLIDISHIESDAVIPHKVDLLSITPAASEFDAGVRLSRGKLPRISEQVLQHNS